MAKKKTKIETLKGNVEAQESRLEEALTTFKAAKEEAQQGMETSSSENLPPLTAASEQVWEMLERIVALEDDLLASYREYAKELEGKVKTRTKKSAALGEQSEEPIVESKV